MAWLRDAWKWLPGSFDLPATLAGHALKDWTLTLKAEVVLVGAGALTSFRTGWSMLLGGLLTYAFLAPHLAEEHMIKDVTYKAIVAWTRLNSRDRTRFITRFDSMRIYGNYQEILGYLSDKGVLRNGYFYERHKGDMNSTSLFVNDEWKVSQNLRLDLRRNRSQVIIHA